MSVRVINNTKTNQLAFWRGEFFVWKVNERRRRHNTKTNQPSFWQGEFFGCQASDNDPTAATMIMIRQPTKATSTSQQLLSDYDFLVSTIQNEVLASSRTMKHSMQNVGDSTPGTSLQEL